MAVEIRGREIRKVILNEIRKEVAVIKAVHGLVPGIATIVVGNNKSSHSYVSMKRATARELGFNEFHVTLPEDSSEEKIIQTIQSFNENDKCHGILVQLPLPEGLDDRRILNMILPEKDVDGFHYENLGRVLLGNDLRFVPCTSLAVMEILRVSGVEISGKEALVIGRSFIVGKPVASLLLQKGKDATVTIAHSKSQSLEELCKRADILVVAIGSAELIKGSWIKPGAIVIDVGMNATGQKVSESTGKTITTFTGDVEFDKAKINAKFITPVPGGVGPLTIAFLMKNTLKSLKYTLKMLK